MKTFHSLLTILIIAVAAGCSTTPPEAASQGARTGVSSQPGMRGLTRDFPGSYEANFVIQFQGSSRWTYTLVQRKTPTLSELSLKLDGIEGSNNPGDIRLVTDGKTSWVTGEGTDNQCMQFPNGEGMDPQWIFPESLISFQDLSGLLSLSGEEDLSGRTALHFTGSAAAQGVFQDVKVEVWQDRQNQSLLRYNLVSHVEDPYFNAGSGQLSAHYEVTALTNEKIDPVQGCEVSVPLPEDAGNLIRLPGMVSFDSLLDAGDLQRFYQDRLPRDGWEEKEAPAMEEESIIMSYVRGTEEVEIHLEPGIDKGSEVKLIFFEGQ